MRNVAFALLLVGCVESSSSVDSGSAVYRQDACASLLRAHESRGCDAASWVCPFAIDGAPLAASDVRQCELSLLSLSGCDVPESCEGADR